jgi:hypothetical protein
MNDDPMGSEQTSVMYLSFFDRFSCVFDRDIFIALLVS